MSEFKVGDRVKKRNGERFYRGGYEATVSRVVKGGWTVWFEVTNTWLNVESLELVQEKEMKYKLETELTFKEVDELRLLLGNHCWFWSLWGELDDIVHRDKRKVVKVGDKEYYEDELSKALSNINAIGE